MILVKIYIIYCLSAYFGFLQQHLRSDAIYCIKVMGMRNILRADITDIPFMAPWCPHRLCLSGPPIKTATLWPSHPGLQPQAPSNPKNTGSAFSLMHTHARKQNIQHRVKPSVALIHPFLWNIPILVFISLLLPVHSCHCHWALLLPSWKFHCNAKQLLM